MMAENIGNVTTRLANACEDYLSATKAHFQPTRGVPRYPPAVNTLRMGAGSIVATYDRTSDSELGATGRPKPRFADRDNFTASAYEDMAELIAKKLQGTGYASVRRTKPARMAASFDDWEAASFRSNTQRSRFSPTRTFGETPDAANFGAANFGASSIVRAAMAANNLMVPGSDLDSALQIVEGFVQGKTLHPKRFGDETFVQRTTSSSIIKLTDANYTEGNTLVLMTPLLSSFKGGVLCQMPDSWSQVGTAGPTATVVGYVTPDRDPEKLGTALNVLAASLKVSAPTVVGGTDTTTAQISLEMAETSVYPLSVRPGKLGPVAKGRSAPITIIGSEGHKIVGFTTNMPDNQVRRFSRYDKQNDGLVRVPGGVPLSDKGGEIVSSQPYTISIGTIDAGASSLGGEQGTGWTVAWGDAIFDQTIIFRLSESVDSNKHMLYGQFLMTVDFDFSHSLDDAAGFLQLNVTYSDGSVGSLSSAWATNRKDINSHYHGVFSSHANTALGAKSGLLILDMELVWNVSGATAIIRDKQACIIRFDEVAAATTYLAAMMSGAKVGSQVNVELITDTEVRPDPSGDIATFVSATADLPYDADFLPAVTMVIDRIGYPLVVDDLQAGTFGEGLRKFFGKATQFFAPVVGHLAENFAPGLGLGHAVNQTMGHGGAQLATSRRRRGRQAASFGSGASDNRDTEFLFPLVSADGTGFTTTVAKVIRGRGNGSPSWLSQLSPGGFHARPSRFRGDSHGLAFLMAYAKSLGYPAKPGLYSGEVIDVYADEHTLEFTVLPIDLAPEKIHAFGDVLIALTPVGWWAMGNRVRLQRTLLFGPVDFNAVENKGPLADNPGPAFTISLRK